MNKWQALSQAMHKENTTDDVFLVEHISPEKLRAVYERGHAVIVERDGTILSIAALWETEDSAWLEIGSLFVVPEARMHGLASDMYPRRLALIPPGVRALVVTHNPRAVHLALKYGFTEATSESWSILAPFTLVCGPCDRVTDKINCPHRAVHSECRLLVR